MTNQVTLSQKNNCLPWGSAPLLAPTVALIAGILLDQHCGWGFRVWMSSTCLAAVAFPLLRRRAKCALVALLLMSLSLGGWLHHLRYHRFAPDHVIQYAGDTSIPAQLRGIVLTTPIQKPGGLKRFEDYHFRDGNTAFVLDATEIYCAEQWRPCSGMLWIRVAAPTRLLQKGDHLELGGWLIRPDGPKNPGEFDWSRYNRRQRILAAMQVPVVEAIRRVDSDTAASSGNVRKRLQQLCAQMLIGNIGSGHDQQVSLLSAMVLGQKDPTLAAVNQAFLTTGTLHFLSVSGQHVGLLAVVIWLLGRLLQLRPRTSAALVMVVISLYVLVNPDRAPIFRAATMCWIFCGAILLGQRGRSLNNLALAALLLLLLRPTDVFSAGFQLSFVVVAGMVLVGPALHEILFGRWLQRQQLMLEPKRMTVALTRKCLRWSAATFSISLAAWLVGCPLVAYHFNLFVPLGAINSFLLLPLVALTLVLGIIKLLIAAVFPSLSLMLNPLVLGSSSMLLAAVRALAAVPSPSFFTAGPALLVTLLFYGFLVLWTQRHRWLLSHSQLALAAALVLTGHLGFTILKAPPGRAKPLILTALDVGHGSATVIETPNHGTVLIDAGSATRTDVGGQIVTPYLLWRGVKRLSAVLITHANIDHYSGIPVLCDRLPISCAMVSGHFPLNSVAGPPATLLESLRARNRPVVPLTRGALLKFGPSRVDVLWPPAHSAGFELLPNERSLVMRWEYGGRRILIAGDNELISQEWLLEHDDLRSDILIAPHHGSVVENSGAFLDAVNPSVVLQSSGRMHSASRLCTLVDSRPPMRLYRTADDGAITVKIDQDGKIDVRSYRADQK